MAELVILIGNDNAILVPGLRAASSGELLNNQTASGEVRDENNAPLASPVTFALTYVAGSDGNYEGVIPYSAAITEGRKYIVHVNVDAGANRRGHWELPATAQVRRA